jgi:hypothetical protein
MRHPLHLLLLFLALVFALASCSDNGDDSNPANGNGDGEFQYMAEFQFNAGGEQYSYSYGVSGPAIEEDESFVYGTNDTSGFGARQGDEYIMLSFPGKTAGTFQLSDAESEMVFKNGEDIYISFEGEINITEYGDEESPMEGAFSGRLEHYMGKDTITISDGQFSAPHYPYGVPVKFE